MHRHTRCIGICLRVAINGCSVGAHLENILVETEDLHIAETVGCHGRAEVLADELCLVGRRHLHTLPTTVVAHRLVFRSNRPKRDALLAPCFEVTDNIIRKSLVVLRQQLPATTCFGVALVIAAVVFHPSRGRPRRSEQLVSLVLLVLFDSGDIFHQIKEVVCCVLHLRVLCFGKALFIAAERERSKSRVARLLRQGIQPLYREIACSYLRTGNGEVGSLLAIELFQNGLTLLRGHTRQDKSGGLGERTADTVDGLALLLRANDKCVCGRAFGKDHRFGLCALATVGGSKQHLRGANALTGT